jgi:endogenous inhibitor of DNA gyrase (YacG/DUF329 family)
MSDLPTRKPCPICGKPAEARLAPFCSKRCADVDLHRWLSGTYVLPGSDQDDAGEGDDSGLERPRGSDI